MCYPVVSPEFCSRGGIAAWRTDSEVRGDKVTQKWKPSGIRSAKRIWLKYFATACHRNWWLWRSNFELTELGRKISTAIVWTATKFVCIYKLPGATCPSAPWLTTPLVLTLRMFGEQTHLQVSPKMFRVNRRVCVCVKTCSVVVIR